MSAESGDARKKRMTAAKSIISRLSGASASMRSRGSSMLSKFQKEMLGFQEHDSVRLREWLLASTEFLLAFSWNCFLTREKSEKTLEMRNITPREDTVETLFWLGFASIGNFAVGHLIDSLTGYYVMALFNVIMHFSLASLFLVGEIVHETSSEDVYAYLLSHIFLWSTPPIKALGFARFIYALDQVGGKNGAMVIHFTFIYNFFSILGGYLFNIVRDSSPSYALLAAIAFSFNGACLFLFAYLLRPRTRIAQPQVSGVVGKVWKVAYTALRNKRRYKKKIRRVDWLEYAENKFDKTMIIRTRRLFRVFLVASPTAGFLLFTTNQGVIFKPFYEGLKLSGTDVPKYTKWVLYTSTVLVVVLVEYGVFPVMRAFKIKINFMKRFLIGYSSLLFALLVASIVSTASEKINLRPAFGVCRIFNTLDAPVKFVSKDDFTSLSFVVNPKNTVSAGLSVTEQILFTMEVTFENIKTKTDNSTTTTFIQYLSAAPENLLQYVTIDPSTVVRVPGFMPILEAPPGQNDKGKPRCFIASLITDREQLVFVTNVMTDVRYTFEIGPGQVQVFQVPEGNYSLRYFSSITQETVTVFRIGAIYGIYLYLGPNEYEINVDTVIPENTNNAYLGLLVSGPMGIARGVGQVALDAFVYHTSPDGLKGTAFGFYIMCSHLTAWFLLIGFHTWHPFISPVVLQVYTVLAFASFLFCLVLLVRYRNHYTM